MAKMFKVITPFIATEPEDYFLLGEYYKEGEELLIRNERGKEYIFDGCFQLAKTDSDIVKKYGEIIDNHKR